MLRKQIERPGWIPVLFAIVALLLAVGISASGALAGVPNSGPASPARVTSRIGEATTSTAVNSDTSPALRDIPPVPGRPQQEDNDNDLLPNYGFSDYVRDTVVQSAVGPLVMPTPILSFDGMYNQFGPIPPDTVGDVGRTQYVQLVNSGVQVFNKSTGASVFGPVNLNTLWYGFGGLCESNNNGDPIVLYDPMADRWMLSQFAFASQSGPTHQCIAISTSPDAAGSYYRYDFVSTVVGFDDYPHYGVWPDAYYMAANRFGGPNGFAGANIAYERSRMLVGDPTARLVAFEVVGNGGALPADFDGLTPPPAGSPAYFWYPTDATTGLIEEYKFHVDFAVPGNSTFTGPFAINVAPWDDDLCAASREACIPQPGTTAQLEAIADRFMHRLAYRNFGTHESVTVSHTVDGNGSGVAGKRWYEVRDPNGARTVFQQGTYAPADGVHRWMGSAAMDRMGNLAVGFSASSTTVFPSLRYAGRLVTDPLGQLSQGEAVLHAGTGSEDFPTAPRWGDYSSLNVDPVDDCTFWYTNEYFAQTGLRNWRTRIGSFRFPSCTSGGATPVVTSTPGPSLTPLPATATPCAGGSSFTGSIANTDPTQNGRLGVNSPATTCAAPRPVPAFSDQLVRHYDQYTYTNSTNGTQCVTVYVTQACGDNAAQSIAYLNTFNPANIQANYLGHGGAAGPSYQYSVNLPAGQTVIVVILEVSPNLGCATYSLSISACAQGTPTSTPLATSTPLPITPSATATITCVGTTYQTFASAGATMIPATTDIGNHCDDCVTNVTLPFPVTVYGTPFTSVNVGSNGLLNFGSTQFNIYTANCLPVQSSAPQFSATLFLYYDDLRTDVMTTTHGIYSSITGVAPNRQLALRWQATYFDTSVTEDANFEAVLTENSPVLSVIYGETATQAEGANAASGIQLNLGQYTAYSCHTDLPNGLHVDYVPLGCGITPTATRTSTAGPPTSTRTSTAVTTSIATNTVVVATPTACPIQYTDVPVGSEFYSFVRCLSCRKAANGYACGGPGEPCDANNNGYFRPFASITRGQISKIVAISAGFGEDPLTQIYTDVPTTHIFYDYINRLTRRGHMSGYPCGGAFEPCDSANRPYFRPGANATRGQLSKIVANAAGINTPVPPGTQTYTDVPPSNPFYLFIERLTALGVMGGVPCGGPGEPCDAQNRPYFRPFALVTRGQAAKIIANTFFPGCETPSRR